MIVLLSPAKSLDYAKPLPPETAATRPRLAAETRALVDAAAGLGPARLRSIMGVSEALATLNAERFAGFADLPSRPAVYAFAGDVYAGFQARTLAPDGVLFAQDHIRILSGLYGLLRPLDAIRPYRLEMGTRWSPGGCDLVRWWNGKIGDLLARDLKAEGSGTILNLASREYFAAIDAAPPAGVRVVTIDFREATAQGLRWNSFAGKKARGAMARAVVDGRVDDVEALKRVRVDGYAYNADASEDDRWMFVRR